MITKEESSGRYEHLAVQAQLVEHYVSHTFIQDLYLLVRQCFPQYCSIRIWLPWGKDNVRYTIRRPQLGFQIFWARAVGKVQLHSCCYDIITPRNTVYDYHCLCLVFPGLCQSLALYQRERQKWELLSSSFDIWIWHISTNNDFSKWK